MSAPAVAPLSPAEVEDAVARLHRFRFEQGALRARYRFPDFRTALAFLVRVGFEAEALGHHPEVHNVYGTLDFALRTHDAGNAVTGLDVALARAIEALEE